MSKRLDTTLPLIADHQYHIFNIGNGGQAIFYEEKNYQYFLEKFSLYMLNYWDVYGFALLPNHFHFAIKIKSKEAIIAAATKDYQIVNRNFLNKFSLRNEIRPDLLNFKNLVNLTPTTYSDYFLKGNPQEFHEKLLQWAVSERFRRFMLGYAKAINQQEGKTGSLFQKLFRRKLIENDTYMQYLILYLHRNPIHHGRALELTDWKWTSLQSILSDKSTQLDRAHVLQLFEGKTAFKESQDAYVLDWKKEHKWVME